MDNNKYKINIMPENKTGRKAENLTGQQFTRLTVLGYSYKSEAGHSYWVCECTCKNKTIVAGYDLKREKTKSCGCLSIDTIIETKTTHGLTNHRLYRTWYMMMQRCYNEKMNNYNLYGGRGIAVCDRWHDIINFIEDMEDTYEEGLSLDRKDNNDNYYYNNCRWATDMEQSNNTRSNVFVKIPSGEIMTIANAARETGKPYGVLRRRNAVGDKDIFRPIRKSRKIK